MTWSHVLLVFLLAAARVTSSSFRSPWWHANPPPPQVPPQTYDDNNHYQNGLSSNGHYTYDSRLPKEIMVDVINNMGLSLLEAHNENNNNNIAISPYGATSVLIALMEGLIGEAGYEIKNALRLPPDLSVIRIGLRDIHRHLKSYFIPKEGFLAGLTLSHDNITLNREYQSILKFYGYDIDSFNNPIYPDFSSTTNVMSLGTMTTSRMPKSTVTVMPTTSAMSTTPSSVETRATSESISTIIEKLTSTVAMTTAQRETTTERGTTTPQETTTERQTTKPDVTSTTERRGTTPDVISTTERKSTTPEAISTTERKVTDSDSVSTTEKKDTTPDIVTTTESKVTDSNGASTPEKKDTTLDIITTTERKVTDSDGTSTTERRSTSSEISTTPERKSTNPEIISTTEVGSTNPEIISTTEQKPTTVVDATTKLPSPDDEIVEGTTSKKLPTRSYTTTTEVPDNIATETIDVTDDLGKTETYYLSTATARSSELVELTSESNEISSSSVTNQQLRSTTNEEYSYSYEESTVEETDENTSSTLQSHESTTFFEATTYFPRTTTAIIIETQDTPNTTTTTDAPIESTSEIRTTQWKEQLTTTSQVYEESTTITEDNTSTITTLKSTTFDPETITFTTSTPEISTFTDNSDVEILNTLIVNNKPERLEQEPIITSTSSSSSSSTLPDVPYTQRLNTQATSLEDLVLESRKNNSSSKSLQIMASIRPTPMHKLTQTHHLPKRRKRSAIDYLIARYYDDYYINANRRYLPSPFFGYAKKTHYSNYQPEEPLTFLVDGSHRETNISFMTYDTILPFYYIRSLDAMALSFPLDSNMYYLLLILPMDEHGIEKLIQDMHKTVSLRNIVDRLAYTHVKAVIPSFMLKGYVVLTPTLQKLKIHKIFEPRHADFSPMTPENNLYVTNIEQAVTVNIRNYADPSSHSARNLKHFRPVEFRADHPFLYFVMDSAIHVNLMAGKIINPLNSRVR